MEITIKGLTGVQSEEDYLWWLSAGLDHLSPAGKKNQQAIEELRAGIMRRVNELQNPKKIQAPVIPAEPGLYIHVADNVYAVRDLHQTKHEGVVSEFREAEFDISRAVLKILEDNGWLNEDWHLIMVTEDGHVTHTPDSGTV